MNEKYIYKYINHSSAFLLSCIIVAGTFRIILGVGQEIYFICIAMLIVSALLKLIISKTNIINNVVLLNYTVLMAVFFSWQMFSVIWTHSTEQYKNDLVLIAGILIVVGLMYIVLNNEVVHLFKIYTISFCFIAALYIIFESFLSKLLYITPIRDFYLTAGITIGIGFLLSVACFLFSIDKLALWGGLSGIFAIALSSIPSRGSLISVTLITFLLIFFSFKLTKNDIKIYKKILVKFFAGALPAVSVIFMLAIQRDWNRARLLRIADLSHELEVGGRGEIWTNALNAIIENPIFGYGLGSSWLFTDRVSSYPHNLFLQVWIDGGIIGLLLLIVVLVFPIIVYLKSDKKESKFTIIPFLCCYIFIIFDYSKSHDFYTSRSLFIFGFILISEALNIFNDQKDFKYKDNITSEG